MRAITTSLFAGLFAVALPTMAHAHQSAAQRTVVVQAEDSEAAILVSWVAPSGLFGSLIMAAASWGAPSGTTENRLKALMTQQALGPLLIERDGRAVSPISIESKVVLDPTSMSRHTVVVLATVKAGRGRLTVRANSSQRTRLTWSDKTSASAKVTSKTQALAWLSGNAPLTLDWSKP